MKIIRNGLLMVCSMLYTSVLLAQSISGKITNEDGEPIAGASIQIHKTTLGASSDAEGQYAVKNIANGTWTVRVKAIGYINTEAKLTITGKDQNKDFVLASNSSSLDEVVVSGTMKEVSKLDSPVPVEVYTSRFFKANPTPSIFESLQNINGVRPQLNCNICNTGDIHINGLEGPYTMVMIDGMPIVSGLSTVYGLSGIPQSLIDRVEIVKGPASTLYGSEAVGGLINIITKNPKNAPLLSADVFGTTWGEINADIAGKFNVGKSAQSLIGVSTFNYANPIDNNHDNFTDVTLQSRVSVFNKWNFNRKDNKVFSLAGRYVYEDRWGGEMNWSKKYRGGSDVYGESIYTKRWEFFGTYDLPIKEKVSIMFSVNGHNQNSYYGNQSFMADQYIGFLQTTWNKTIKNHDILTGVAYRYTYYNDNTVATELEASKISLPGLFVQDEISLNEQNKLLVGARYDYNSLHGSILTPRINYKWNSKDKSDVLRLGIGNGYRVANIFTEDHAALTGARKVIFEEDLNPETSWNANLNYVKKFYSSGGSVFGLDATAFYTYFNNKIIPDYETNVNEIRYSNLDGHAVSKGLTLNADASLTNGLKILIGATLMDVYSEEKGEKIEQMLTEKFMGTWSIGYTIRHLGITVDYTGNLYGPMRLPLLGDLDPRPSKSPWWSIQNIQLTKAFSNGIEIFGGVKNLLNWTPGKNAAFLIARAEDPFDKNVQWDSSGNPIPTPDNPYALTFDPNYVYAPNQGIRGFLGFRYNLFK
ncbi:TonB-dependent receptor [Sphingobacterium sp. SYP-B4668]|uniref:TonB-dependent receptor n=1 Tax=Sphingobacterium sp. SYP-B4668 TaxID=2996035 RepID=UPI0022DD0C84|nr:TonB-dependent receptor [Sphingobacterium sp. SYP-B4668]